MRLSVSASVGRSCERFNWRRDGMRRKGGAMEAAPDATYHRDIRRMLDDPTIDRVVDVTVAA